MARVTNAEVQQATGETGDLLAKIDTANVFVDANLLSKGLSDSILKQIELYLAAHFVVLTAREGPLAAETLGDATERYHDVYGPGLRATRFGQQAIILDSTGTLSELASRAEALGKKEAELRVV